MLLARDSKGPRVVKVSVQADETAVTIPLCILCLQRHLIHRTNGLNEPSHLSSAEERAPKLGVKGKAGR